MEKAMKRHPSKDRPVKCDMCGTLFLTNHSQGKYCSQECKRKGERTSWNKYTQKNKQKRRVYFKKYYQENKENIAERITLYQQSLAGKRVRRITDIRQRQKNPEKYKARQEVLKAIRKGILTKQPCEICGDIRVEAHHDDYNKPLKVTWLCKDCHKLLHIIRKEIKGGK